MRETFRRWMKEMGKTSEKEGVCNMKTKKDNEVVLSISGELDNNIIVDKDVFKKFNNKKLPVFGCFETGDNIKDKEIVVGEGIIKKERVHIKLNTDAGKRIYALIKEGQKLGCGCECGYSGVVNKSHLDKGVSVIDDMDIKYFCTESIRKL